MSRLVCFPGMLGEKSDFDFLAANKIVIDLFRDERVRKNFAQFPSAVKRIVEEDFKIYKEPYVGIGYSLGGRLLLHCALAFPDLFKKLVILSAHTGLQNFEEKKERSTSDKIWADRFLNDTWDDVLKDWNSQSVLQSTSLNRAENNFDRQALSHAFTSWSLGEQDDLVPRLANHTVPTLWIVGEHDPKFKDVALRAASVSPAICVNIIPAGYHRLMWEKPKEVATLIHQYVENT